MKELVIYIHGKGGSAMEAEHFRFAFPESDVIGLEYAAAPPLKVASELRTSSDELFSRYPSVTLIANSIGAYYAMRAFPNVPFKRALFISPIVDMERMILDMLEREGILEEELRKAGFVKSSDGEVISWEQLSYERSHRLSLSAHIDILCGEYDALTSQETFERFAAERSASLTVMPSGEHWFHTDEQMAFLDSWLARCIASLS